MHRNWKENWCESIFPTRATLTFLSLFSHSYFLAAKLSMGKSQFLKQYSCFQHMQPMGTTMWKWEKYFLSESPPKHQIALSPLSILSLFFLLRGWRSRLWVALADKYVQRKLWIFHFPTSFTQHNPWRECSDRCLAKARQKERKWIDNFTAIHTCESIERLNGECVMRMYTVCGSHLTMLLERNDFHFVVQHHSMYTLLRVEKLFTHIQQSQSTHVRETRERETFVCVLSPCFSLFFFPLTTKKSTK